MRIFSANDARTVYGEEDIGEDAPLTTGTIYCVYSNVPDPPNNQYESKSLGTWSSASDVNSFLTTYNAANGYEGLKLGNYVTINDGTYNVQWEIAGFNMEYKQTAADGTVYDNGVGICMIPKTQITSSDPWDSNNTVSNGYKSSTMHTTTLPTVANSLKTILGNHLINRNVLLSNSIDSSEHSNNYTWTTSYATLMSVGQCTGTFASHWNIYDDGEANYKLPLFNYESLITGTGYWLRNIYGNPQAYRISSTGSISNSAVNSTIYATRPLIYIQ